MKKSWLVGLAIVVVLVLLGVWSASGPAATVEVVQPQTGTITAYVEEQAVTRLPHDYLVAMPIAGWLEPIRLREGDLVEAGAIVARLEQNDLLDRVHQAEQRIAVLQTRMRRTADHRLEENALVETEATVKAIDETVQAAEAKLGASQAVLDFARSELERVRELSEADSAAQRELRAAETAFRKARAEYQSDALELAALKTLAAVSYIGPKFIRDYIDRKSFEMEELEQQLSEAQADLDIARRNLARTEIAAPITGVVLQRHNTRHQYLPAGTPLLTLGDLDELEVIAEVLTEQATRIQPDDPVEVFGEGVPDGPLTGNVLRIYPAGFEKVSSLGVEQQRVEVAIGLEHRPAGLGAAYRVHVKIETDRAAQALILPRTALFRGSHGHWQVIAVENEHTVFKPVEIGLRNADHVQILSGLDADARVVRIPSGDLHPDMHVATTAAH